jgi:S-adenosyl-L-methionine hydrolase (adenosine-forming)
MPPPPDWSWGVSDPMSPIFLLTDFGLQDAYVGQMKAVLLARAPDCAMVDLTHGIEPQDVEGGARVIEEALPYLPRPAVILAVVDPGVGTDRRPIAVRWGDLVGVGPDNGLMESLIAQDGAVVHAIDPRGIGAEAMSSTFHGRDLFAPVAAFLASGGDIEGVGPVVEDPVPLDTYPGPTFTLDGWVGRVRDVDRFGNLITDLGRPHLGDAVVTVELPDGARPSMVDTYGEANRGQLCALVGSGGWLEIAVNGESAAESTGLGRGAEVKLLFL